MIRLSDSDVKLLSNPEVENVYRVYGIDGGLVFGCSRTRIQIPDDTKGSIKGVVLNEDVDWAKRSFKHHSVVSGELVVYDGIKAMLGGGMVVDTLEGTFSV